MSYTNPAVQPQKMVIYRREISNLGRKNNCTIYVVKTKVLISCLARFALEYAKFRFSHDTAHFTKRYGTPPSQLTQPIRSTKKGRDNPIEQKKIK